MRKYIEIVASNRSPKWNWGVVFASAMLLLFAWLFYYSALEPIPNASEGYQQAARASRFAHMGWALFFALLGLWQGAKHVRSLFGLPTVSRIVLRRFIWIRNILIGLLLFILLSGLGGPVATTEARSDERWVMGLAAGLVWLMLAIDLIPLVRIALRSLRARVSGLRYKYSTVDGHETGAVRIWGTVAPSPGTFADDLVYLHETPDSGGLRFGNSSLGTIELRYNAKTSDDVFKMTSFLLESDGHRLSVDVVDGKTVFATSNSQREAIAVGDEVEVWGHITRPTDAFRGQLPTMSPGDGRLYVFAGDRKLNRRLLLAAIVELLAAGSLVLVGVFYLFFAFDLYLFMIA